MQAFHKGQGHFLINSGAKSRSNPQHFILFQIDYGWPIFRTD